MPKGLVSLLTRPLARTLVISGGANQPAPPSEYITNGTFSTDTDWDKIGEWAIEDGMAITSGGVGLLSQDFSALVAALTNGADYVLTYDLVNVNGGQFQAIFSGGTGNQTFTTTSQGPQTVPFTATDARTTLTFRSVEGEPVSLDNVSLVPA